MGKIQYLSSVPVTITKRNPCTVIKRRPGKNNGGRKRRKFGDSGKRESADFSLSFFSSSTHQLQLSNNALTDGHQAKCLEQSK